MICEPLLIKVLKNLTKIMYLPLPVRFMITFYVFMMLISVLLLPLKELQVTFFCKANLVVMNCLTFCLFMKLFILPLFLKHSYRILGSQLFSLNILKVILFPWTESFVEKSATNLIGVPNHLSLFSYFFPDFYPDE